MIWYQLNNVIRQKLYGLNDNNITYLVLDDFKNKCLKRTDFIKNVCI